MIVQHYATLTNIVAAAAIILLILYWIHTFIILYHLIRFGVGTRPKQVSVFFFIGSLLLFIFLLVTVLVVILTTK